MIRTYWYRLKVAALQRGDGDRSKCYFLVFAENAGQSMFSPVERTRVFTKLSSILCLETLCPSVCLLRYRLILSIWLTGPLPAEDELARVAARPAAGVPFDWLSVFVLMHAITAPCTSP